MNSISVVSERDDELQDYREQSRRQAASIRRSRLRKKSVNTLKTTTGAEETVWEPVPSLRDSRIFPTFTWHFRAGLSNFAAARLDPERFWSTVLPGI